MYGSYVQQMNNASTAKERKAVVDEMCRMFAFSQAKAYKVLKEAGWSSGRKERKDAGSSSIDDKTLEMVAALLQNGVRKNGKQTMSVGLARSILVQNGFDVHLGDSRLRDLLNAKTLSPEKTKTPKPYQKMRSLYPNQVHFADPSMALIWFAPDGSQKLYDADEVYKNKNPREGKLKCWRYVLTDHTSSSICVRYYAAMGETAVNMYDFLLYAWGKKSDPLYGFHGLPELLVWDPGSANISRPVSAALKVLRVETNPHLPGNPRAKGQVEKANDIVETQFESLLKLEPVHSIEELNNAVERWCAAFNANMIPGRDTRLSRNGKKIASRLDLWNRIEDGQIRELPDVAVCRQIFTTGIQVRRLGGDLCVSVVHPQAGTSLKYSLVHLPGILVGMNVNVQPLLVDEGAKVVVSYEADGNVQSYELEPVEFDETEFALSAPVYGKEYKKPCDTAREVNVKKLAELAGDAKVPFAGATDGQGLKTHSLINAKNIFASQRTGTQISVETVQAHDILISGVEAAKRVKARLGYVPDGFIARMQAEFNNAVPANLIDDLAAEYTTGADQALSG